MKGMTLPKHLLLLLIFGGFIPWVYAVDKPLGVYASSGALVDSIYDNPNLKGVLVRATWATIESSPGEFDFTKLDAEIAQIHEEGKSYSLAIAAGGIGSPDWLIDISGASYIPYTFRGEPGYRLPLIWDSTVQERLRQMALALAARYKNDSSLKLVYVSQMTSNGLEGHLQGVDMVDMFDAGYSDALWISASISNAKNFAFAFNNKALAFEVHNINGSAEVPMAIINTLWEDELLAQRVGAAMWWLSGKTSYQPELVDALTDFQGDIYAQGIGNSSQADRFENDDYSNVFEQAKSIGIRYIEPWEYEFKYTALSAKGAWDNVFSDFNQWALTTYANLSTTKVGITHNDTEIKLQWQTFDHAYQLESSNNLAEWLKVQSYSITQGEYTIATLTRSDVENDSIFFRLVPGD